MNLPQFSAEIWVLIGYTATLSIYGHKKDYMATLSLYGHKVDIWPQSRYTATLLYSGIYQLYIWIIILFELHFKYM